MDFTIARQGLNSILNNVLNSRVVPILFHKSPGNNVGTDRAIPGINWQVQAQGFVIQNGVTTANGRIDMTVRGGSSMLQLLEGGAVIAEYDVSVDPAPLAAVATLQGQKQRLRLLGYQIGRGGPDQNGVDATANVMEVERSVLDFQADESQYDDAVVIAATQNQLTARAGA